MTIKIPLTQGKVAIVDDIDADLADVKWFARFSPRPGSYYAQRTIKTPSGRKPQHMHRVILERKIGRGLKHYEVTDHTDNNPLNNTRENLRIANHAENARNSEKRSTNRSGVKGVWWDKHAGKWRSQIGVNKKRISLGLFDTPEEAHAAYCAAAEKYHGEFANFGTAQS